MNNRFKHLLHRNNKSNNHEKTKVIFCFNTFRMPIFMQIKKTAVKSYCKLKTSSYPKDVIGKNWKKTNFIE